MNFPLQTVSRVILAGALLAGFANAVQAQSSSDFPSHTKVLEGYQKVVTKANIKPMYTLYKRTKDNQMYAELPRTFSTKKYFMAMTVASGDSYAGLQSGERYVYWRRYNKRLALIEPNISVRAKGDKAAASSVKRLFTDRLLLDIPIVCIGPSGGPVIDMDALLVSNGSSFFGSAAYVSSAARLGVFSIKTAKAFEKNIEISFEVPSTGGSLNGGPMPPGSFKELHYSISEIPDSTGYKPRKADTRIGYFTTTYTDLAKYNDNETAVRFINRWHLEKADSKLKISPPKKPIVFYIEHTTPVRYRRWVKEGILSWNKAFENIGISDAIEVYYQDASSGAHMDKDPEDVNYNFVRWLNNNVGTAIGPSRVHPLTGQILDADIVLTDGWIRHYRNQFSEMLPKIAMEGMGAETLAWLAQHPEWDPRVRLASPANRLEVMADIQRKARLPFAGHAAGSVDPTMIGDDPYDGLLGRSSQVNGYCIAADGLSFDMAMMRMHLAMGMPAADAYAASIIPAHPLAGRWNGSVDGLSAAGFPVDSMPIQIKFEANPDDSVTGTAEIAGETDAFQSVTFDKATGAFSAEIVKAKGKITVELTATLSDGTLSGDWEAKMASKTAKGKWTAEQTSQPKSTVAASTTSQSSSDEDEGKKDDDADKKDDEDEDKDDQDKEKKDDDKKDDAVKKSAEQMLDGIPETFVGPLVAHLVAHEVGHTLGLRHNFKGSSLYTMEEINSDEFKNSDKQMSSSVMDYVGVNIAFGDNQKQGDWCMTEIGPYDMWAIEYGYTFKDTKKVLARVAEPELAYGTDEDTSGPDPFARRYDFSKDPLDYATAQVNLAKYHRGRLLTEFIKDGDSWDRVRYGYELTLSMQVRSVSMMSNWLGGAFVYRDKKGDPNGRKPIEVVSADQQRAALQFVIDTTFNDEAFGLTPELAAAMGLDKWSDDFYSFMSDATWPIHDRIMGIQSSALTQVLNPTTLNRIHDNELRISEDEDALTLPELLTTVSESIWSELDQKVKGKFTARKPLVSSLRRNLQREHIERLIDLALPGSGSGAASRAVSQLAGQQLREISAKIESVKKSSADKLDAYTIAHLNQAHSRIQKALDADYILNPSSGGGGGGFPFFFGAETPKAPTTP